ncbi:MAG: response regulator [Deltaproteobacteria bacterium]|nr:response regulator [Deltaproteobacteria bacterium]MBW2660605.1 response regulator [Deltaproteobacteria bacterium]
MSKLLLIDDEEGIRKVLSLSLQSDGHDVTTAENGQQALKLFREEPFPIVLTDIKMPGMDGIEVLKEIKKINPNTEVIVITGHGDMESAVQSLHLGASDFINKPVSDQVLSIALKRAEERLKTKKILNKYANELWNMVKEKTKEIKRRYEFEDKLIQRSIDGIIATDRDGNIIVFNRAAENLFGYTKDEVKSEKKADDLYPKAIMYKISDVFSGKTYGADVIIDRQDTFLQTKNGKLVPVRFSGAILYEGYKPIGSVGFFQDLREIKRLQKELIQSERLAAVGQTVAGLAHGIKNILNGLKGGVYIVNNAFKKLSDTLAVAGIENRNPENKLKTGWEMVERNINRVSDLVLDLLSYSKEREPEYERYDPNIIVDEVCDLMELKAKKNDVKLIRSLDKKIGEVYLDPKGIHICLLNLISNAIDACIFDPATEKDWQVKVEAHSDGEGGVIYDVLDNGCGMNQEVKDRIFTEFFSTKGNRGTGLGLLVSQKIIHEHKGSMDVKSQPGKGTKFLIKLPKQEFTEKK